MNTTFLMPLVNATRYSTWVIVFLLLSSLACANDVNIESLLNESMADLHSPSEVKALLGLEGVLFSKNLSGAAFAPLYGGEVTLIHGCVVNRPTLPDPLSGPDLDMYSSVSLPEGSMIVGMSAYFLDIAHGYDNRPSVILQRHNGVGDATLLATAQSTEVGGDFPGFYEILVDISPAHEVTDDDFFNLIFTAARGDTSIINAYYVCAVKVYYQNQQAQD